MAECPGIYKLAEMKDGLLARLRIPGGIITSDQARCIAIAAKNFGNGTLDLTNRANIQLRGIKRSKQELLVSYLQKHHLVSADPNYERLSNITIDPLSGVVAELVDCRALAGELNKRLKSIEQPELLSPKISFILDGGGPTNISALTHDFAFKARDFTTKDLKKRMSAKNSALKHEPIFSLLLCGQETGLLIKRDELVSTILQLLKNLKSFAARAEGENSSDFSLREDQTNSLRPKTILQNMPFAELVSALKQGATCIMEEPQPEDKVQQLSSITRPENLTEQIKEGDYAVNLYSPTARLQYFQLQGLSELADQYGSGELRLTSWQAIILPDINEENLDQVWERSEALALLTQQSEQNLQIISCAGSEGCIHGGFETKLNSLKLRENLTDLVTLDPVTIHLSACEKGCATRQKTDYLIMQKRGSDELRLHINESPMTKKPGKVVAEDKIIEEIKKLI